MQPLRDQSKIALCAYRPHHHDRAADRTLRPFIAYAAVEVIPQTPAEVDVYDRFIFFWYGYSVFYRPVSFGDGPIKCRGRAQPGEVNALRVSLLDDNQIMRWAVYVDADLTKSFWLPEQ